MIERGGNRTDNLDEQVRDVPGGSPFLTFEQVVGMTRPPDWQENLTVIRGKLAVAFPEDTELRKEAQANVTRVIGNLTLLVDALGRDDLTDLEVLQKLEEIANFAQETAAVLSSRASGPQREVFEDDPGLDFRHYPEDDAE